VAGRGQRGCPAIAVCRSCGMVLRHCLAIRGVKGHSPARGPWFTVRARPFPRGLEPGMRALPEHADRRRVGKHGLMFERLEDIADALGVTLPDLLADGEAGQP
jgi:hypothetical protein